MNNIQLVQAIMAELDKLTLKSVRDWEIGVGIAKALLALKKGLEDEQNAREQTEQDLLKEARANRQAQLKAAAENGGDVVGGETIRINGDGSTEVLIP